MRRAAVTVIALAATSGVCACAVAPPPGPSVMALPGQGKDFATFQQDDVVCRDYAWQQSGGASPGQAASQSAIGSAVVGTALGAAAGAAIGAASAAAGPGAAIGAGVGLLAGSPVGATNAAASYGSVQASYDVTYAQCIIAHGNPVEPPPPVFAGYPHRAYPYPCPSPFTGYYGSAFFAPSIAVGIGTGWGWGWGGGGWHGW